MIEVTSFLELPPVFIPLLDEVLENRVCGGGSIVWSFARCVPRRSLD